MHETNLEKSKVNRDRYIMSPFVWSIELHFQVELDQISKSAHSYASMASKGTPKKHYNKPSESTANINISRCRLCNCVADPQHSKLLFRSQNQAILRNAEIIYGDKLPQDSNLPRMICRPCERRLNNAINFKNTILATQRILHENVRAKRCVEVSPSVVKPPEKVRASGESRRRRSIDFNIDSDTNQSLTLNPATVSPVSIRKCFIFLAFGAEICQYIFSNTLRIYYERRYSSCIFNE